MSMEYEAVVTEVSIRPKTDVDISPVKVCVAVNYGMKGYITLERGGDCIHINEGEWPIIRETIDEQARLLAERADNAI